LLHGGFSFLLVEWGAAPIGGKYGKAVAFLHEFFSV
jgi:hypothetical protein